MDTIAFRRLTRADFALLAAWLTQPHVERWWNHDPSLRAIEADFGAAVDGTDPTDVFIATLQQRPVGLILRYTYGDNPAYIAEMAPLIETPPDALSLDYLVGEPGDLARGIGSAMIRTLVERSWGDHPAAPSVIVPVNAANTASCRVLERAGFAQVAEGPLAPDNPIDDWHHLVYAVDRPRDRRSLVGLMDRFEAFSPDFMPHGREFHEQTDRDGSGSPERTRTARDESEPPDPP